MDGLLATKSVSASRVSYCADMAGKRLRDVCVPERFDQDLTIRWTAQIADAMDAADADAFEDFIELHPELLQGDLLGLPGWVQPELEY